MEHFYEDKNYTCSDRAKFSSVYIRNFLINIKKSIYI